ncbi:hypothetical protein VTJ04DRAFT_10432 [Mycothermus thermophilus]|uniref:uncharacterized protein n=1 Tax=Humicola insolens TaxID=85995 RepID=UPI003743D36C
MPNDQGSDAITTIQLIRSPKNTVKLPQIVYDLLESCVNADEAVKLMYAVIACGIGMPDGAQFITRNNSVDYICRPQQASWTPPPLEARFGFIKVRGELYGIAYRALAGTDILVDIAEATKCVPGYVTPALFTGPNCDDNPCGGVRGPWHYVTLWRSDTEPWRYITATRAYNWVVERVVFLEPTRMRRILGEGIDPSTPDDGGFGPDATILIELAVDSAWSALKKHQPEARATTSKRTTRFEMSAVSQTSGQNGHEDPTGSMHRDHARSKAEVEEAVPKFNVHQLIGMLCAALLHRQQELEFPMPTWAENLYDPFDDEFQRYAAITLRFSIFGLGHLIQTLWDEIKRRNIYIPDA